VLLLYRDQRSLLSSYHLHDPFGIFASLDFDREAATGLPFLIAIT
jgi:hypothetical protein